MEIKKFEYEDIEQVFEIARRNLKENYTFDLFLHLWHISPYGFLVARENNRIVGFIIGVKTSQKELRILLLAVDEKYRRKGIGSMLLKKLLLNFPDVRRIYLETRVDNMQAIKFYMKHGFRIVEKIKNFYTDGSEAYIMEKVLW